ncbi:hypothetical protein Airi02_061220 [Actinoallomurus iriomotensis]|uniref:Uncharacterized protein n=2 Tax=Actinoallomurus iriomotensis TaxID=478107 RepID=A0A9W6VWT5_9ACTN|nr:hypothetical protein Airi02_061220 [Actinoallomurus iriomotensis]
MPPTRGTGPDGDPMHDIRGGALQFRCGTAWVTTVKPSTFQVRRSSPLRNDALAPSARPIGQTVLTWHDLPQIMHPSAGPDVFSEARIMNTYSISVRLQRTTTEECHVSVPVTGALLQDETDAEGMRHLDGEKVLAAAVQLGREATDWLPEAQDISVHPVQKAPDAT